MMRIRRLCTTRFEVPCHHRSSLLAYTAAVSAQTYFRYPTLVPACEARRIFRFSADPRITGATPVMPAWWHRAFVTSNTT